MTEVSDAQHVLEPVAPSTFSLLAALEQAEPKPAANADRAEKKNYAQRLSNSTAQVIADGLRQFYPTITPDAQGREQEARVRVASGTKRLDVKVTDPSLGLLLSVSIKTYSFPDYTGKTGKSGRFTKNVVRNDHELRGEAAVLHQRQPYSVVIGVFFTPIEAALDGVGRGLSSFAHQCATFRKRAGRGRRAVTGLGTRAYVQFGGEDPRADLCERMFIGLYETRGDRRGHVRFFDVENRAPEQGLPSEAQTYSFDAFIAQVHQEVQDRNAMSPNWDSLEEG
jgi:hypothetical protein